MHCNCCFIYVTSRFLFLVKAIEEFSSAGNGSSELGMEPKEHLLDLNLN